MSSILYRLRKNPETIHIKTQRFLKKKMKELGGSWRETHPYRVTVKELKRKLGVKKLKINQDYLFEQTIIKDTTIVEQANAIMKGHFHILGNEHYLPNIDWHKDERGEYTWEKVHFTRIGEYDQDGSDKKFAWDLSKFGHLTILGLAYQETKEKKYIECFQEQINDWIQENPYEIGINWVTPMEVAIRAVNLLNAYYLFKGSLTPEFWTEYIKQLYLHGKFIEENIEWSPQKENHYLCNMLGLFFLGTFFKHTPKGQEWIRRAQQELEKEILAQVAEDGVDYEASLNYHRLVTELFLLCILLGKKNKITFSPSFMQRAEAMCNFIMHYTKPDGKAPAIGDTDNGRILDIWDQEVNDHRDLLSVASTIFNRPDFKAQGNEHSLLFLLINEKVYKELKEKKPILKSKKFTDYYIIRDQDLYILIHCGDIGRNGFGGHGHNDQLSFTLNYKGEDYIIDPGTYCYTGNRKLRHQFRSTAMHNTVVVDRQEQNKIKEDQPFDMEHQTEAQCIRWEMKKDTIRFFGRHSGFSPNILWRELIYNKKLKELTIKDTLKDTANMELSLHLHPTVTLKKSQDTIFLNNRIQIIGNGIKVQDNLFSKHYGLKENSKSLYRKKKGKELVTKIMLG